MKKAIVIVSALLALVACNKENSVQESAIDPSKVVFNIDVRNADAQETKGVKTAWENGDVVYVFFEDNIVQYVKMTYNGSSWIYTDNADNTSFSGLALSDKGEKVSAVYLPAIVSTEAPTYTDKWTFGSGIKGYFQYAESVDYTVTNTETPEDDIATLNATISLAAPANIVQVYVNETAPASGNEYVLNMTNVKPFTFEGIAPGGVATVTAGTANFPLTAYSGEIGGESGYYFWGILANASAGTIDYNFQLVTQNATNKYAISSKSKSLTGANQKNLTGPAAIKLSGLTDKGNFVSLGYAGGPLWATGNIDKTNSTIVDPLEAGEYFRYGKTTPYSASEPDYTGTENPLSTSADVAYAVNNAWRIPTKDQFDALINSSNTTNEWVTGRTNIGSTGGGRFITSKANGLSLFFAAAGSYYNGSLGNAGDYGSYWSSTPYDSDYAYNLYFNSGYISTYGSSRNHGFPVRPVQN